MRPINPDSLQTSEWRLPIQRGPAGDQHQNSEPRYEPPAVNAQTEDSASPGPSRLGDPKNTGVPLQALADRRERWPGRTRQGPTEPSGAERGRAGQSRAEPSRAEPNRAEPEKTEPRRAGQKGSPAEPKANSSQAEPAASVAQTPSWRESCPSRSQPVPAGPNSSSARISGPRDPELTIRRPVNVRSRRHLTVTVTAPRRRGTPASRPIKSLKGRGEKPRSRDGANPHVLTGQRVTPSLRRSGSAPWS